jgi:tRNA (guanine37-N1)-methyltransferase
MHVDVVTIFPQLFDAFRLTGVLGRAVERAMVSIDVHDLRDWAGNRWRQVDDEPYGGGAGMVMQVPPVVAAVRDLASRTTGRTRTVLMTPRGRKFDQRIADEFAAEPNLIVLCGRYEGFDERILDILHPDEVSIGDFILGGGEVAAMAVIESVTRLIPGVVGDPESVAEDSFSNGLLDYPCYTRPLEFEGREVPEVLRSGNHEAVRRWRLERSVEATVTRRPDLVNLNWKKYPEEVRLMVEHFTSGAAKDQE